MKNFLKYTLATIVGVIIVQVFIFLFMLGIIGAMATMGEETVVVKDNSILEITFKNVIQDKASTNPLDNFDFFSLKSTQPLGLNKILKSIDNAAKDDRIKGIYLNLMEIESNFSAYATVEEIRHALEKFKESGKFIYSYANFGYSQKSYYLASIADSIFTNPETPVGLSGLSSQIILYKNMLDNLGVKCQIVKVGKYKSAVEPFIQTEISEENREQVKTYISSLWNGMLQGISQKRNIAIEDLNHIVDNFDLRMPAEEIKLGLLDGAIYEDQMIDLLKTKCGLKEDDKLSLISLEKYQNAALPNAKKETAKEKIAVIYATGEIGSQQTATSIGPELAETIRKVRKDNDVKAIVMRVNSPGGSALTSDIIWREVKLAKETKPFIVSMGNVAASGGYYIACAADTIVADAATLTGSIGVFGMFFTGEKLIKEKIGLTSSVIKTNSHSDFGGAYPLAPLPISNRSLNTYEQNLLQKHVEQTYGTFLSRVSEGRGMTKEQVHEIAQGRVWTGSNALEIGLVDVIGGINDAINIAAEKAALNEYKIVEYPTDKSPLEGIMEGFSASMKENALRKELGSFYDTYSYVKGLMGSNEHTFARIPYNITID